MSEEATTQPPLTQEVGNQPLPLLYRFAQAYLALLIVFGGIAAWRIYGMWSDAGVSLSEVLRLLSNARLRELPEATLMASPIWMPVAMILGSAWIYLLGRPRKWFLWATFVLAAIALLLILRVDGDLKRIEGGYYSKSHWVELFWQMARPIQVASLAWLGALPVHGAISRWHRSPRG